MSVNVLETHLKCPDLVDEICAMVHRQYMTKVCAEINAGCTTSVFERAVKKVGARHLAAGTRAAFDDVIDELMEHHDVQVYMDHEYEFGGPASAMVVLDNSIFLNYETNCTSGPHKTVYDTIIESRVEVLTNAWRVDTFVVKIERFFVSEVTSKCSWQTIFDERIDNSVAAAIARIRSCPYSHVDGLTDEAICKQLIMDCPLRKIAEAIGRPVELIEEVRFGSCDNKCWKDPDEMIRWCSTVPDVGLIQPRRPQPNWKLRRINDDDDDDDDDM
jgi:hypothetical protein